VGEATRTLGAFLAVLGALATCFAAFVFWLRATADVGEPLPVVYVVAVVGPLLAVVGGWLFLRRGAA